MRNFRTFNLAADFYRVARTLKLPRELREQLVRAASSVALNLAEGRGKPTRADQLRFFHIAFGSLRECQAVLILAELEASAAFKMLDSVAAHLYRLIQRAG